MVGPGVWVLLKDMQPDFGQEGKKRKNKGLSKREKLSMKVKNAHLGVVEEIFKNIINTIL